MLASTWIFGMLRKVFLRGSRSDILLSSNLRFSFRTICVGVWCKKINYVVLEELLSTDKEPERTRGGNSSSNSIQWPFVKRPGSRVAPKANISACIGMCQSRPTKGTHIGYYFLPNRESSQKWAHSCRLTPEKRGMAYSGAWLIQADLWTSIMLIIATVRRIYNCFF